MNTISKRILTSIFLILLIYLSLKNLFVLFALLLIINFLAIKEFKNIFNNIFKKKYNLTLIFNIISILYLVFFSLTVWIHLYSFNDVQIISIIFLLCISISTDIGGFVVGKLIGGKKLTKISPNKTYAGMLGSFLFAFLFTYLFYNFQKSFFDFKINVFVLIFIISIFSQIGDLIFSYLKRKAKMKDTGSILPGHGGILDRIDGILLALPIGIILIST